MTRILSLLVSICLFCTSALAQEGHDFLALGNPNFSVQAAISAIRPGAAIGVFDDAWPGSFGNPEPKLRKLLATGKVATLRVQIYWSYSHDPAPLKVVKKALPKWIKLQRDFPNVKVLISPSCEYRSSTPKSLVTAWVQAIKAAGLEPVLSPMPGAPVVPGVLVEHHGDKVKGAQAVSLDGQSFADADTGRLLAANPKAKYFLAWLLSYNCSASGNNPPPSQRKDCPTEKDIRAADALFAPKVYGNLKPPQLYKVMSEAHVNGTDPREKRPLLILKEKAPFAEILDSNGAAFLKFPYYSTYLDQGHRYYSGSGLRLYGYEIAELARKRTGSSVVKVKVNKNVYTIGSAEHRQSYYQK